MNSKKMEYVELFQEKVLLGYGDWDATSQQFLSDFPPKARVVRCNHEPQMFPSSNSAHPFPFTDQPMFGRPFINDISLHSKDEEPLSSSFFHLPSPFVDLIDEDALLHHRHHDLLVAHLLPQVQQQQQPLITDNTLVAEAGVNIMADSNKPITTDNSVDVSKGDCDDPWDFLPNMKGYGLTEKTPRKRSGKKDRHSKIYTAQGPRDRRMRLSLDAARKFFDLQDMLGFDKASKTIEWLLTKSKTAIKELTRGFPERKRSYSGGAKSVSSTSECEVVSGMDETANNGIISKGKSKDRKIRQSCKASFHHLAKESREKARERARERTKEKMRSRKIDESKKCPDQANPQNMKQLRSSSPFETREESGSHSHHEKKSSTMEVVADHIEEPPNSHSLEHQGRPTERIVDEDFGITSKSNPSSIFNYQHNIGNSQGVCSNNKFPDFPENWGINSARMHSTFSAMTKMHLSTGNIQERISSSNFVTTPDIRSQSQFGEFQFYG